MRTSADIWLELLLRGATAAEFDAALEALQAEAGSEQARRELADQARQAALLRAELHDNREQRAQLVALFDVAVRLSAVRDVDALLQEVVTQVRRLLEVDVAYLALIEDDGDLVIRVTEGSLGPRLRGVRIPPHTGLAGRVVDSGEPVTSLDYVHDPGLAHEPGMDEIATDESLRMISGVPLRIGGRPTGVLMIANRDARTVRAREMSLLSSLASMVAVVTDNARLIDQLSRTAEELTTRQTLMHRAAQLHESLMDAALRGGVDQVVAALSESVGGTVTFTDTQGTVVAAAQLGQPVPDADVGQSPAVVPVAAVDVEFGVLKVRTTAGVDEPLLRQLQRAALTVALIESTHRAIAEAEGRTASELLEQVLLRPADDDPTLARRLLAHGLDLRLPHHLVVIEADPQREARTRDWAGSLTAQGGMAGRVEGRIVAAVREGTPIEAPSWSFGRAGRAGPAAGAEGIRSAYQEARSCLAALDSLGRSGVISSAADLGPYHFLLNESGRASAGRFVESVIGPLMRWPRQGGELAATAETYLGLAGQHRATAAALAIHPNTLYQRLERIASILGPDWKDAPRALDISLAFRINRLIGPPGPAANCP